jgi:hypothetical protein
MLVLLAFVAMMTYFVVRSVQTPLDLVTEKYYEAEIKYQDRIDDISNEKQMKDKVEIGLNNQQVEIQFPENIQSSDVKGKVKFYYAADSKKDKEFELDVKTGNKQLIDVSTLRGAYSIQIDWKYLDKTYYNEKKLFL